MFIDDAIVLCSSLTSCFVRSKCNENESHFHLYEIFNSDSYDASKGRSASLDGWLDLMILTSARLFTARWLAIRTYAWNTDLHRYATQKGRCIFVGVHPWGSPYSRLRMTAVGMMSMAGESVRLCCLSSVAETVYE